ncbi:MAG: NRDE family protein [Rhodocyclaceae bacterium]|nr:MAG: NRDE family protein [Rhodocyclaceae bacterium]
MCLILLAWQAHPEFPLVVAANRDEFHNRPTAVADYWQDRPDILAGRDLVAGGTWMGMTLTGRFAALTNYRDPAQMRPDAPSRGPLVSDFLTGNAAPQDYLQGLALSGGGYNGFNLLVADRQELFWYSNMGGEPRRLAPGIYGLSNELLDTPWPKVEAAKSDLSRALEALPDDAPLFRLLRDDRTYPDDALPRTGVSLELERMLSAAFITSDNRNYGTRSSTVLIQDRSGLVSYDEQTWLPDASAGERRHFSFRLPEKD